MAVTGVGDHQRLHGDGVLLHQVGDAGVGVDHDFVGEAHLAAPVAALHLHELFAERPVVVAHRHAHRGVGVHHLLRGDHFDLVRVGVEPELAVGQLGDGVVVLGQGLEVPVGTAGDQLAVGHGHATSMRFLNRRRNTG